MPLNALFLLTKYWKYLAIIIVCIFCYLGGLKSHKNQETIVYKDRIVEKTVEIEKKSTKNDKTTTIIKNKDGSSTTTVIDKGETTVVSQKEKDTDISIAHVIPASKTNYSLGLSVQAPLTQILTPDLRAYSIDAGKRLFSDVWLTGTYTYSQCQVSWSHCPHSFIGLGVRYEF